MCRPPIPPAAFASVRTVAGPSEGEAAISQDGLWARTRQVQPRRTALANDVVQARWAPRAVVARAVAVASPTVRQRAIFKRLVREFEKTVPEF